MLDDTCLCRVTINRADSLTDAERRMIAKFLRDKAREVLKETNYAKRFIAKLFPLGG